MKKFLLLLLCSAGAMAQSVGILGSATPTGWDSDTDMATSDNVTYTITMTFTTGEVKFRQDDAWTINWGANTFPTGTGTSGGPNIPVPAGTYAVTFNRLTGAYAFEGSATFPSVGILGTAVGDDFAGPDTDMVTIDGENYTLSGFSFTDGQAKFRQDNDWTINWGSDGFPSGTAVQGGPNIPVSAGTYTVSFNRVTGAYDFGFVSIGILGSAIDPTTGWDADIDMATTDGVTFTLNNYTLLDGELKFRQDNAWTFNWGGAFPSGTGAAGGANIAVTAGTYDITFNRNTLEYSFTPSLGVHQSGKAAFSVSPNPARDAWQFSASGADISDISVYDVSGKLVISVNPNAAQASVPAAALCAGVYFAKVQTGGAVQTVKIVRQ